MNRLELTRLREKLQAGGVAWKHIKRLIREIQDHREDLTLAALHQGSAPDEANHKASEQLGHYDQIADAMLSRRELRSLGSRYPITCLIALPVISYIVLAVALLALFIGVMTTFFASDQIVEVSRLQVIIVSGLQVLVMYLLAPILALLMLTYAVRNNLSLILAAIGATILVAFSCSIIISVSYPDPVAGTQGSLGATIGYYLYNSHDYTLFAQRLTASLAVLFAAIWAYRSYHLSRAY